MSAAYFADPDAHGIRPRRGLPQLLPPTLTATIRATLAAGPPEGMPAALVTLRVRDAGHHASEASVSALLYHMSLDGRAQRERTSARHPWRYRVAA